MNDKLLYFPYINIPDSAWTVKSILYWDNVGVIVPQEYIDGPNSYEPYTRQLLETDLVEQVVPYQYTHNIPDFSNEFIKFIRKSGWGMKERRKRFENGYLTRIHVEKFGGSLMGELCALGVSRSVRYPWYEVEAVTASQIMFYLATVIAKRGEFTPATDDLRQMPGIPRSSIVARNRIRQRLLDQVIPYPLNPDLTTLRRFKDRYHSELYSFRILLEQAAISLQAIKDPELRDESLVLKIVEIMDKKAKIISDLKGPGFGQIVFGSVFGVLASALGFSAGSPVGGTMSLINAAYNALQGYNRQDVLSRDFAYLALIDKKLIA